MWEVYEHKRVDRQLKRLPAEVLKRYEKWKDIVTISGPQGLRMIKGFHDESLFGKWKGHRSSDSTASSAFCIELRAIEYLSTSWRSQPMTIEGSDHERLPESP